MIELNTARSSQEIWAEIEGMSVVKWALVTAVAAISTLEIGLATPQPATLADFISEAIITSPAIYLGVATIVAYRGYRELVELSRQKVNQPTQNPIKLA